MASGHKIQQSRRRIFSSVFPSSPLASELPTPVATPDPSFLAPGQAFGVIPGDHGPSATHPSLNIASERTKWNRAWHTVTSFLILPREVIDAALDSSQIRKRWLKRASLEVSTCLEVLVSPFAAVNTASDGDSKDSIVEWYLNEVRRHYLAFVRPNLLIDHPADYDPEHKLSGILETLQLAQHIYLHPLIDHILPALSNPAGRTSNWSMTSRNASEIEARFRRDLQAIIVYSLPADQISSIFGDILTKECSVVLGITNAPNDEEPSNYKARDEESGTDQRMSAGDDNTLEGDNKTTQRFQGAEVSLNAEHVRAAREKILYTFQVLENVGLGQERGQRVFAEVMNKLMSEHVRTAYSEQWEAPSQVTENLKDWIENHYARLVVEVLHCLQPREQGVELSQSTRSVTGEELVCFDDVQKWQDMGIGRLGRLRVKQLFDIVVDWDASLGAVEDLKARGSSIRCYRTNAKKTRPTSRLLRLELISQRRLLRLLHPGASTVEILQAYICLIRSFDMLDPRGVLLDRVARPIRRYLRDRDDTVKVIVTGLLADVEKEDETQPPGGEILTELAIELSRASDRAAQSAEDDGDLDWDDLEWVPDPIDAGPGYIFPPPG
ncbi:MAG: hypothetical protein M1837_002967 [Sclerophora amabilis]|nr:MAG: hypothetical protein M1837_002967 [Sclerophora amabilis]